MRRLRTEVDWGLKQDPAACRADAAIILAERGFTTAAALAAGNVACQLSANTPAAQVMVLDDLSIRHPSARGSGSAGTSVQGPNTAAALAAGHNGGEIGNGHGIPVEAFVWDPALLAYECSLFARKFPSNTSARVQEVLGLIERQTGL